MIERYKDRPTADFKRRCFKCLSYDYVKTDKYENDSEPEIVSDDITVITQLCVFQIIF